MSVIAKHRRARPKLKTRHRFRPVSMSRMEVTLDYSTVVLNYSRKSFTAKAPGRLGVVEQIKYLFRLFLNEMPRQFVKSRFAKRHLVITDTAVLGCFYKSVKNASRSERGLRSDFCRRGQKGAAKATKSFWRSSELIYNSS